MAEGSIRTYVIHEVLVVILGWLRHFKQLVVMCLVLILSVSEVLVMLFVVVFSIPWL